MKFRPLSVLTITIAAAAVLPAQTVKFDGALIDLLYTQMLDNNLRLNSAAHSPAYNSLVAGMTENQILIRRAELYFSGKITENVFWNIVIDPNQSANASYGTVLHDAAVTWKMNSQVTLKLGQLKFLQTYEGTSVASKDLLFYDRAQLSRVFGDRRDRGIMATYGFGDPKGFNGKINIAVTNGMSDNGSGGKQPETNAQKDFHFRLDLATGLHKFGTYYRTGSTDVADKGGAVAGTTTIWGAAAPGAAAILDNKDKTTNLGFYYFWDTPQWQVSGEAITGLLGRRFPSMFATATVMSREHLDQKFLGYYLQGAYKMGKHWITARYDFMNYNSGNDWYTAYNPYTQTPTGALTGSDFTPKFTEIDLGYTYVFTPGKSNQGKFKLNYVMRSKNFLKPRAGQTGEQGGDSLVASFQVAF